MQHQISIQDLLCGKTSQEPSAAMGGQTSEQSSKRSATQTAKGFLYLNILNGDGGLLPGQSWEMVSALPGVSTMLNFGESPKDVRESTLSQILQANAPEKYYLSPKACRGILNRAERRGKRLPDMLKEALEEVIAMSTASKETESTELTQPDAMVKDGQMGGASYTLNTIDRPAIVCLNDQGGAVMDVSEKAMTLRAQEHGHQPIVCYGIENHAADSRVRLQEPDEPCQTLTSRMGTGGG